MNATSRRVLPELLDELRPDDPRALRSRKDLRRVHRAMRSVSILRSAISALQLAKPPRTVIELGAGDGTLLLRLARALKPRWTGIELTLLDRHDLLSAETRDAYAALGWTATVATTDVLAWARETAAQRYDLCLATLFLHHFTAAQLDALLPAVAYRSSAFVACEPRRDVMSRLGSLSIGLIGGNDVTREDAVTSVAAGFRDRELTAVWRHEIDGWTVKEYRALPFTHCFAAARNAACRTARRHAL